MLADPTMPLALVEIVAAALHEIADELVFVGGAITGLLITDTAARPPSATKDVDVIVSVTKRADYLGGSANACEPWDFAKTRAKMPRYAVGAGKTGSSSI
jgi:hypothetical protein